MQHRENIILYNVLNQEIVFEEYFCNLLYFDSFRNLFIDFINNKNKLLDKNIIKYKYFNTEVKLNNDNGRADLFLKIKDTNEEFIFEIKNKVYTNLTTNQPNSYLNYLNNKHSNLFFLIPGGYKHKDEIIARWKDYNNVSNQILYWEDFINKITESNIYKDNTEINMFYKFCLYWFDMKTIEFNEEENKLFNDKGIKMNDFTNTSIPTMIQKLEALVNNIGSHTNMKIDNDTVGYNYSKIIKDYIIYFGVDYNSWENNDIPLSIVIQSVKNNHQEFKLNLKNINTKTELSEETSNSIRQFSYIVKLNDTVGSKSFQENTIKLIFNVLKQLS